MTPIFLIKNCNCKLIKNLNFRQKYSSLTPFLSQFVLFLTSHNSTSPNIVGTDALAVPPPQIWGRGVPRPPKSPPMDSCVYLVGLRAQTTSETNAFHVIEA